MRTVRFPNRSTFSYVLYGEVHMLAAKNKVFCALVLSLDRHDIQYICNLKQLAPHRFQTSFACLAKIWSSSLRSCDIHKLEFISAFLRSTMCARSRNADIQPPSSDTSSFYANPQCQKRSINHACKIEERSHSQQTNRLFKLQFKTW